MQVDRILPGQIYKSNTDSYRYYMIIGLVNFIADAWQSSQFYIQQMGGGTVCKITPKQVETLTKDFINENLDYVGNLGDLILQQEKADAIKQ